MKKIGIMGGTFNPIHMGHLILAETAYIELDLDEVLFMPSKNPPHKDNSDILPDDIRSAMIKCAICDNTHFVFSDFELRREGITYTADTLKLLLQEDSYKSNTEFYFCMGADSFLNLEKWYKPFDILKMCHIIVAVRDNVSTTDLQEHQVFLLKKYGVCNAHFLKMPNIEISSAMIRKSIQSGTFVRYNVPAGVYDMIIKQKLYKK